MRSVFILAVSAAFAAVWGQAVSTSQIGGTVQDASGLAVPDAAVRAVQTATGAARSGVTGPTGSYLIPELPIGPYRLEVSKEGFSKYVQTGIVLQVDSNPTINVTLKIGAVSEEVSVTADAAMVETHSTGVGEVVNSQDIVELPLNGRQAAQLIYLSAGATEGRPNRTTYPNRIRHLSAEVGRGRSRSFWMEASLTILSATFLYHCLFPM